MLRADVSGPNTAEDQRDRLDNIVAAMEDDESEMADVYRSVAAARSGGMVADEESEQLAEEAIRLTRILSDAAWPLGQLFDYGLTVEQFMVKNKAYPDRIEALRTLLRTAEATAEAVGAEVTDRAVDRVDAGPEED